jgi:hypothetical protein
MDLDKPINKSNSRICMNLTSSTGTWLNGCLQPQHFYVSLGIEDPESKILVRVGLSFEQAARMLLYNGDVECTLERYRNTQGELVSEVVTPPETVHERMKDRMGDVQASLLKRIEDVRRDLDEMVNGDGKRGKTALADILREVEVIKSHFNSNQSFVLQQAEEELSKMKDNAVGQIGTFLQSKLGIEAPEETLKALIHTGQPALLGEPFDMQPPVEDNYELKPRVEKTIDQMTPFEVASLINRRLHVCEAAFKKVEKGEHTTLYSASASCDRNKITITYISYQSHTVVEIDVARRYAKHLKELTSVKEFKHHWDFERA